MPGHPEDITEHANVLFSLHGQPVQDAGFTRCAVIYGQDPHNPYSWRVRTEAVDESGILDTTDVSIKDWVFEERSKMANLPESFPVGQVDKVAKELVGLVVAAQAAVTEEAA